MFLPKWKQVIFFQNLRIQRRDRIQRRSEDKKRQRNVSMCQDKELKNVLLNLLIVDKWEQEGNLIFLDMLVLIQTNLDEVCSVFERFQDYTEKNFKSESMAILPTLDICSPTSADLQLSHLHRYYYLGPPTFQTYIPSLLALSVQ